MVVLAHAADVIAIALTAVIWGLYQLLDRWRRRR
jgi:hypothetical protein